MLLANYGDMLDPLKQGADVEARSGLPKQVANHDHENHSRKSIPSLHARVR